MRRQAEQGVTLVFALCMLVVVLLLGVSAAQLALQGERSARAERDRQLAFQAAEEALMDAQSDIDGRPGAPGRSAVFDSAAGFAADCAAAAAQAGLCLPAGPGAPPVWLALDLGAGNAAGMVEYGRFTGARMAAGDSTLPSRLPRYLIEQLPAQLPGMEAGAPGGTAGGAGAYVYRITAIGFGAQADTQVVLQTYYRKRASGAAPGVEPGTGAGAAP